MNVLVVGGTRFIGYHLTWRLLSKGHGVTHFNRGRIPDPFGERIERLQGDRTTDDFPRLLAGRTFDVVVDFAAYHANDVAGVMSSLAETGQYVFISTGQVYLVKESCRWPATEEDYNGPLLPEPADAAQRESWLYGIRKRQAEDLLADTPAFPSLRIRIPMVNGERDYYRRIECYLWRIFDGGPLILPDGGSHICRHVYGPWVAEAICSMLGRPDTYGKAFNLAQSEKPTLSELVELIAREAGWSVRAVTIPYDDVERAGISVRSMSPFSARWMSLLDPSLAERELNLSHPPLAEYIGRIVSSCMASLPRTAPPGYEQRAREMALARSFT